jgi:hypothetical protein
VSCEGVFCLDVAWLSKDICRVSRLLRQDQSLPRTGEIAIFANFTKFTGSLPPFFFCLFNLLRMVRLLHMELLRETPPTVSKPTT